MYVSPVAAAMTPSQRRSMEAMTMELAWVPPEMKKTSASGQAQAVRIFSFALAQ